MPRLRPSILVSLAAVGALALLAAGCGGAGGSAPQVASVASSTTTATTPQTGLVAYAHCMRTHGVGSFPDPNGSTGISKAQVVAARMRNPDKFNTAETACHGLLPTNGLAPTQSAQQQRTQLADELSFARCMRSHGIARFPDPNARTGLTVEMVEAQGIDVRSPAVLRIVQKCLPASHGGLTPAKVREAIQNAGG